MYISKGQKKDKHLRVPTRVNVARACKDATIQKIKDSLEEINSKRSFLDDKRDDLKQKERVEKHKNRLNKIRETKKKYNEENESFKMLLKEKDCIILTLKQKVKSLETLLNCDLQNDDNGTDIFNESDSNNIENHENNSEVMSENDDSLQKDTPFDAEISSINLPLLDEQEASTSIISIPRTEKKVKSINGKKRNERLVNEMKHINMRKEKKH